MKRLGFSIYRSVLTSIGLILILSTISFSQVKWTLEQMDHALTDPIEMKQLETAFGGFVSAAQLKDFNSAYGHGLVAARRGHMSLAYAYFERAKSLAKIQSIETMAVLRREIELDMYYADVRYLLERGTALMTAAQVNHSDFYLAMAYRALAEANYQQGKDDEVLALLSSASSTFEKSTLKWPRGLIDQYQGFIAMSFEDYSKAEMFFDRADEAMTDITKDDLLYSYDIFREFKDILVDVKVGQTDVDTAIRELQALNQKQNELGESPVSTQVIMLNSGRLLHEQGRYQLAEIYFSEALLASEKIINDERHTLNQWQKDILLYSGLNAYALGDYRDAADYFERAVNLKSGVSLEDQISDLKTIDSIQSRAFYSKINLLDALAKEREAKINSQDMVLKILILVILGVIAVILLLYVDYRRINDLRSRLYQESITDHLTQLYNRGKILSILEERIHQSGMVALLDIDHFKRINDTYGHPVGDAVLKEVAMILKRTIRASDVVGRFGGEEFLLIINDIDTEAGIQTCERIRQAIEAYEWAIPELKTTISIGAVSMQGQSLESLICKADQCLYLAKASGRNQVKANCL